MLRKLKELSTWSNPPSLTVLLGVQGAGKGLVGSIASLLIPPSDKFFLLPMSLVLKERAQINDELGKKINDAMERGELADDPATIFTLDEKIYSEARVSRKRKFTLDGFPRNKIQAIALLASDLQITTFYIDISDDVAVERITRRAVIENRIDDQNPVVVRKRIELFRREENELIRLLKGKDPLKFHRVDGTLPARKIISTFLKIHGYGGETLQKMMANLDKPSHPAHTLLKEKTEGNTNTTQDSSLLPSDILNPYFTGYVAAKASRNTNMILSQR
jgi:adenylate kinase family enzyme